MIDRTESNSGRMNGRPPEIEHEIQLSDNARVVLERRYLRKDSKTGQPAESIEEMFWRVASHVAAVEEDMGGDTVAMAAKFYDLLTRKLFFPNSPTFTGAGTPLGQLAACFVLPISDDMGREETGIFQTLRDAALVQQTGGGNGFAFSRLRPKGAIISSSGGQATGPIGFLRVYDQAFGEIAQGGCLTGDTLVFTEDGLLRLDELVTHQLPGWYEHELMVATDQGPRLSTQTYNNDVVPVMNLRTQEGIEVSGTPNHKFKVMSSEGLVWRELKDISPGDAILVKLGQHRGKRQSLLHPERSHGNQLMPDLPEVLDEEIAFLLGYMVGDGFVAAADTDHRIGFSVAHDSYLIDKLPAMLNNLFGQQINVRKQQKLDDASVTYVVDNRAIKDFLQLNGLSKAKSADVRVPRLVRKSPPEIVGAYLRGLFEADGSVVHGYPELLSSSEILIREVATLLIGLGCPLRIRQHPARADRYGRNPLWSVRISSHVGLQAWKNLIGCDEGSRFSPCYEFEPDLSRENVYELPVPGYWVGPVLEATRLPQIDRRGRGHGKNYRSTSPRLRRQLLRYTRGERALTRSGYKLLAEGYNEFAEHARSIDGEWFVTVSVVEDAGEALTLDLEVEDNHTYLANGLTSHNTRRGANMAVLRVDHPDIREFITCKVDENQITNFNISVGVTDAFMQAVEDDTEYDLINPQDDNVWETVRAREIFDLIITQAHHNGEPGILFLDEANRTNPVPQLYELEATNPCLVGNTRIATHIGLLTIEELARMDNPSFISTDNRSLGSDTFGVALRAATPAWMTKHDAPVLKLTTKQGYTVTATPDHQVLTTEGYFELQDLSVGDKLLLQSGEGAWSQNYELPNAQNIRETVATMAMGGDYASGALTQRRDFQEQYANLPVQWSHSLGQVMGWLIGDGWLTEKSASGVGFVFASDENLETIHEPLRDWFGQGCISDRGAVKQLTYSKVPLMFFKSLGMQSVPAHKKRVPDSIWTAPREVVVGFLQGLFSADGTVGLNESKRDCTVRLASSSRGLLEDTQILLSNFGIISKIYRRRPAGVRLMLDRKGGFKDYQSKAQYELVIGKANRDRFAVLIGFADSIKQATLVAFIESKVRMSNREAYTDAVLKIEEAGTADVYDITEPQTHSLIANGMVVHNCGEQFLGPGENCCLGSINLAQHVTDDGQVDWLKLQDSIEVSTHFLENVVSANAYVPGVPQLQEAAHRVRRIGLGIMGLGDLMYQLGIRYGSRAAQEFAGQIMEFVRYHSMLASIELAEQRGPFPAIKGSLYDPDDLKWSPPRPLEAHQHDWGRPALDWDSVVTGIKEHGIRNGAQTTIAPTGTISTVAGCEAYGCEPAFALAYMRHFNDNGRDVQLQYTSPLFEKALIEARLSEDERQHIIQQVMQTGTCQNIEELPEHIRDTFVVSGDVTPDQHVRMQAALQAFVDNSISKTCNFPANATEADVADVYKKAWKLGCKGMTVYVTGSRDKVVLETAETAQARQSETEMLPLFNESKKPRPTSLPGTTHRIGTPAGVTYVTVSRNGNGEPFEVFIQSAKAGSETNAVSEALGRLMSYILRLASPVRPTDRLEEIVRQLEGIGGGRPLGLGPNRVLSLPDGVAQALARDLGSAPFEEGDEANTASMPDQMAMFKIGDLCPECGESAFVQEEGCRKCYACGFSEC